MRTLALAVLLATVCCASSEAQQVQQSPLVKVKNGREAANNNRIVTTGIRSPISPDNRALIISVSEYPHSTLPGVKEDRATATELAKRFGVADENVAYLSEKSVTRERLQSALDELYKDMAEGGNVFIYYSGHGARRFDASKKMCAETLVMQDEQLVTNDEFSDMIKPLAAKAGKTVVMLDSCHSGGMAEHAATRSMSSAMRQGRPKYDALVSSPECSNAVNIRAFSGTRGVELDVPDNNLVVLAASQKNEVAWDTNKGGAMTYNFMECVKGGAVDEDRSGSVSMQELVSCVQERLGKAQEQGTVQHLELTGNKALVPGFEEAVTNQPGPPQQVDALAALKDILAQRDERWEVNVTPNTSSMKIGVDNLDLNIESSRDGYVYIFYLGTSPDSFYLLFPNKIDAQNAIKAKQVLNLPAPDWTVSAGGPAGTDHVLVMVTQNKRDLGNYALPEEYINLTGTFGKIGTTVSTTGRLSQVAVLSSSLKGEGKDRGKGCRDLVISTKDLCSNVFGASLIDIQEAP